ncbi:MAG: hypothetical protein ACRD0P_25955, partial [Stackebrandtia sp.]
MPDRGVQIQVPMRHPRRHELLRRQWRTHVGHLSHVRDLRFPRSGDREIYRYEVRERLLGDIAVSRQYTDRLGGLSGTADSDREQVGVHIVSAGALWLNGAYGQAEIGPGMLCIRDLRVPWEFAFTQPTSCTTLILPHAAVAAYARHRTVPPLTVAHHDTAESQLFLSHLTMAWKLAGHLSGPGTVASRESLLVLLAAIVDTDGRAGISPPV